MITRATIGLLACLLVTTSTFAESTHKNTLYPSYDHDHWKTSNSGILKDFAAYRSSFDDSDDNDKYDGNDNWGVPIWVAYQIKRFDGNCIPTHSRPGKWLTDSDLNDALIMPDDKTYSYSADFRKAHPNWFSRGHLAAKVHAERLGEDSAWFTHTFYNAVPQRQLFNAGIWLDLENLTAAWAQKYGQVWVIDGPIFADRYPIAYLDNPGTVPAAIPEALFKIVIKEGEEPDHPDVLAFIYPQVGPGYTRKNYDHTRFITTVDEIEQLTGIDFLMSLPNVVEKQIEAIEQDDIWTVEKDNFINACRGGGD